MQAYSWAPHCSSIIVRVETGETRQETGERYKEDKQIGDTSSLLIYQCLSWWIWPS